MASGDPFVAIIFSFVSFDEKTRDIASNSLESGYSLIISQFLWICSVPFRYNLPMPVIAFSMGSNGLV